MEEKVKELYQYYLNKKLDSIFDGNNPDSITSPIVENYTDYSKEYDFFGGYHRIKNNLGMVNYQDFCGRLLLDEWVDEGTVFSKGYATVQKYFKEYGCVKYNVIDNNGNLLGKKWFDDIVVDKGNLYGINKSVKGDRKLLVKNYINDFDPKEAFKKVTLDDKFNYKRIDGSFLLDEWVDYLGDFNDGFAYVEKDGKCNLVDTDGNYLSKNVWFNRIQDFYDSWEGKFPNLFGYVCVYKNGYFNLLDIKGNLLFDWISCAKFICPTYSIDRKDIMRYINLNGYRITKHTIFYNELSNGKETYRIKGYPIRVYDNFILCARCTHHDGYTYFYDYYLYDKSNGKYKKIGKNIVKSRGDYYYDTLTFDDNFIHDYFNKKVYLIYGNQVVDVTEYYNKHFLCKKNISVNKGLSKILTIDEFHYENLEDINNYFREEEKQKRDAIAQNKERMERERIARSIVEFENDEAKRTITIAELVNDINDKMEALDARFELLEELKKQGAIPKIPCHSSYLFKKVDDHLEFRDVISKKNRFHMFDLSKEKFINVKMDHLDFQGCNLDSIIPTKVYNQSLRGSNFSGVHFMPFTSFEDVDIRGCTFSEDNNHMTMDVMPNFSGAKYDETTTYNGIPLTDLIKKDEPNELEIIGEPEDENISTKTHYV